jgi:hypothetical protein
MTEEQEYKVLFDGCRSLEADAKAISGEIKERLETFAQNKQKDRKSIKDLYKKYKDYCKDPEKFVLVDYEVDSLLNLIIPEYAGKEGA